MKDKRFPTCKLIEIKWCGAPPKIGNHPRHWKPLYCRMSNAAQIYLWPVQIIWRMPWLPCAAYSQGWDACWRQMHAESENLKAEIAELKATARN